MGKLAGALAQQTIAPIAVLLTQDAGDYQAYFLGHTSPVTEQNRFNDMCRLCKGQGTGLRGEPNGCVRCKGTRIKSETRINLRYQLQNGNIEEESVTFKLSAAGINKDKTTRSASTFFLRLRAIAGLPNATEDELDQWYSSLPEPIRVPCRVDIDWNEKGDGLKISAVRTRRAPQGAVQGAPQAAAPRPAPPAARAPEPVPQREYDVQYDAHGEFIDDSVPF